MVDRNEFQRWIVLTVRVPSEPSRHRVAVWRELRRAGGIQLAPGTWAITDREASQPTVARVRKIVADATGDLTVLSARGHEDADEARLAALFVAARDEEWREFIADCDKLVAEVRREIEQSKLTLAELEEEEQSLERLRRWHRELRARDVIGAPSAAEASESLAACETALSQFEQLVFDHLDQT